MNKQQRLHFNRRNIAEFRASGGKIASFGDAPLLLLTTVGARSGKERVNPIMYMADGADPGRVYVFASAAGAERNPAWYDNLVAHPEDLTVEIGDEKLTASAAVLPSRSGRGSLPSSLTNTRGSPTIRRTPFGESPLSRSR